MKKKQNEQFNKLNEELTQAGTKAHSYSNILMPIMGNLSYLHYALTAVVGGLMLAYNVTNLTVGKLGSFLQLTRQFSLPITNLSQLFMSIMTALAGAERVFNMMDEKVETDDGKVTLIHATKNADGSLSETNEKSHLWAWKVPDDNGFKLIELKGDVRLEHVIFGYEENKIILNDLSLYAKPGQKIAFVGSTGAGKTTITNLINRFYDINSGKITYDGIDIKDIKKDDLRHSLAMVLQDTHLFTATVMENIRYGNSDATDEECINAAKIANCQSFH
jgi:ABC-type multidrug transport system, ATPase and permease components